MTLKVLPNFEEDKYSRYVEDKKKGLIADKIKNKWYNDFSMVGAIGELWTAYKKFFEINSYKAGQSFHVNLLEAESENIDSIANLRLYVYGKEQEGFMIPVQPENPSVCRKERNRKLIVKVKNPQPLQGPSAIISILVNVLISEIHRLKKSTQIKTEHPIAKHDNETTILITDLEPEETYNITVSYVTEFGSGEPSEIVQAIGTLDNLRKTDGCIIDNDEKFKNGSYAAGYDINTITACAEHCADTPTNIGWSYEFSTKSCFISSEEYTETVTDEKSNETTTIQPADKEFKAGWASGTLACSKASDIMTSCSKEDEDIKIAFLVTGGLGENYGFLNSSELQLLGGTSSCEIPNLPDPVHGHVTFVTGDGFLASCSGTTSTEEATNKCLVLDIGSGAWEESPSKLSNLEDSLTGATTVTLPVGVYIIGGHLNIRKRSTSFLPAGSSEWQDGPEIPRLHLNSGACAVHINDNFLVIGGGISIKIYSTVYEFDPLISGPSSDVGWFIWPSLKTPRYHHACALMNNKVIVAGGIGYKDGLTHGILSVLKSTEIIDLATRSISSGDDLKVARHQFGMVTVGKLDNQMVLAFGGFDTVGFNIDDFTAKDKDWGVISSVEKLEDKTWVEAVKKLKESKSNFGFVAVNVKPICRGALVQDTTDKKVGACTGCMNWAQWTTCSPTCGKGKRFRTRSCSSNSGEEDTCQCKTEEDEECNTDPCPVNGLWSEWSSFSACSTTDPYTCGTKSRTRTCTNPVASNGGKNCQGRDIEIVGCSGGQKLPLKVIGHCQETKSNDDNIGQEALVGCFPKPEDCLKACQENSTATGCEYNIMNKNCYIHTAHLTGVNKEIKTHICWLFIVNELPGSCTDEVTAISGNFTSEECLESCQEKEDAEGCQYDLMKKDCSFFTCPMLKSFSQQNSTCWTFNKGSFNGYKGTNCGSQYHDHSTGLP